VGECFVWYRLTRVDRTKGRKTVVVVVVANSIVRSVPLLPVGVQPTLDPNPEAFFVSRPNALAQEGRRWVMVYANV